MDEIDVCINVILYSTMIIARVLAIFAVVSLCYGEGLTKLIGYTYVDEAALESNRNEDWSKAIITYINYDVIAKAKRDLENDVIAFDALPLITGEVKLGSSMKDYMNAYDDLVENMKRQDFVEESKIIKRAEIGQMVNCNKIREGGYWKQVLCCYKAYVWRNYTGKMRVWLNEFAHATEKKLGGFYTVFIGFMPSNLVLIAHDIKTGSSIQCRGGFIF